MPVLTQSPILLLLLIGIPLAGVVAWWIVRRTKDAWLALAFGVMAFFAVALQIHYFPHGVDDAFISFRYAENLAKGEGLCFNPGERVEGFSNPLWVFALSGVAKLGINRELSDWALPLAAKLLGLLCHALMIALIARWILRAKDSWLALLAALAWIIAAGPNIFWAMTGMETVLHSLLLIWAVLSWSDFTGSDVLPARPKSFVWAILLLILSRPEGVLLSASLLGLWAYGDYRINRRLSRRFYIAAILFVFVIIGVTLFRWLYFGDVLPNTFYAKATGNVLFQLRHGFQYLAAALLATGGAVWIFALWQNRSTFIHDLAPTVLIFAQTIFILLVGGDWMMAYRFWAIVIPVGAVGLARFVHYNKDWLQARQWRKLLPLGVVCLAVLQAMAFERVLFMQTDNFVSGFRRMDLIPSPSHYAIARKACEIIPENALVAIGEAGIIPYLCGFRTLECYGLLDRRIASRPGLLHEKARSEDILARRPDYILLGPLTLPVDSVQLQNDNTFTFQLLRSAEFANRYQEILRDRHYLIFKRSDRQTTTL